jgi:hypothetical protein
MRLFQEEQKDASPQQASFLSQPKPHELHVLQGLDRQMIDDCGAPAQILCELAWKVDIEDVASRIQSVLLEYVESPEAMLRKKLCREHRAWYYDTRCPKDILRDILPQGDQVLQDIDQRKNMHQMCQRLTPLTIQYTTRRVHVVINHALADGIACMAIFAKFLGVRAATLRNKYPYIPGFTEARLLPHVPRALSSYTGSLRYVPKGTPDTLPTMLHYKLDLSSISVLKHGTERLRGSKVSFSSTVSAIIAHAVFTAVPHVQYLTFGIIVAFQGKNSNNLSMIPYRLQRPDARETRPLHTLVHQAHKEIMRQWPVAEIGHVAMNIHNRLPSNGNSAVDVMLSGLQITKEHADSNIRGLQVHSPYPSSPVYCCYVTTGNTMYLSLSLRTPDLDTTEARASLGRTLQAHAPQHGVAT